MFRSTGLPLALAVALTGPFSPLAAQQAVNLPASDRALQPTLEDVYRVGKIDGAAWEIFGTRVEVAFDGQGNLHVFDPENFRVVVVSPTGAFLRTIGRRGDGPGELRSPAGFAVLRDGTVVIADIAQRSLLVFGRDGTYQRSVSFGTDGMAALGQLLADPRGGAVLSAGRRVVMMQQQGPGSAPAQPSGRPVVRFPLDGSPSREIHTAWEAPRAEAAATTVPGGGGGGGITFSASMPRAFEPGLLAGALPNGGFAFSDSSAYAIKVAGPDGDVQRVLRRPILPQPVTPQVQTAERNRRLAQLEAGGGPQIRIMTDGPGGGGGAVPQAQIQEMMRNQIEQQLQFYPELPVVTGLVTGWTGKVWVARRGPQLEGPGPVDVLSAEGEYLGTIAANGMRLPAALGPEGFAAHIERDQFDVVSITVRRLPAELR